MRNQTIKTGSMMLVVVLLMSILLVLCTRMWRSTAYILDIALQKQLYMQKKWATQGIFNAAVTACRTDFSAIHAYVTAQGGSVSMPVHSYALRDIPCLVHYIPMITFSISDQATIGITVALLEGEKPIFEQSGDICKSNLSHNTQL